MIKRLIKELITPGPHWRRRVATAAACWYLLACTRYPRMMGTYIAIVRALLCKPLGHRWSNFAPIPGGDFGTARRCPRCGLYQRMHRGKAKFYNTHSRGGWTQVVEETGND